jgi:DNA-binding cell septation regulator SpoVG
MADVRLRLVEWRQVRKGRLYGFASVEFEPLGLKMHEIPILMGKDGPWACVPTKPRLDGNGQQQRDVDGSPRYDRVLSWSTKRRENEFSDAIVKLVRRKHAQDLDRP